MTPEQWKKLDDLFHEALELDEESRAAFLLRACGGDERLREEAVRLIAAHEREDSFIDSPIFEQTVESTDDDRHESPVGRRIGPYQVVSQLGRGGMGEVYLAEDSRLGRKVAIKLLPAKFTADAGRVRRFEQEARASSSLNHPNIITVHDIGEIEGKHYLVEEFIDGQTLRQLLNDAPQQRLEIERALDITAQMARALAAAHEAGIVHRDIKPENVMVRHDGLVKVLDFGLAKLTEPTEPRVSPIETAPLTLAGVESTTGTAMGTVGYMSPEQPRGQEVDHRSDLFSLGVVLYEMIAGGRPFAGATASHTIVSILEREPEPLEERVPRVPAELEHITEKCLAKNRDQRYRSAQALLSDMISLRERSARGVAPENVIKPQVWSTSRHLLAFAMMMIMVVAALVYALLVGHTPGEGTVDIKSLAVLPFESLDPKEEDATLGLKLADALILRLGRLRQIVVRTTRAVERYASETLDPLEAGRQQQVDVVLVGNFQRAGERLRVRARLLRTSDGQQLWAGVFDERGADSFILQDALAEQTAQALVPQLTGRERKLVVRRGTESVEANRLYTEGRYYWNKRNVEGIQKCVQLLEQALKLDSKYALAYAGLADSYITLSDYDLLPASVAFPKARDAAQRALKYDDSLAEAHTALAVIKANYDWDWAGADHAFEKALEINPNYATAHQWYAEFLTGMGRHEKALEHIHHAAQLDPLSLIIQSVEALILIYARDYDGAIAQCRRVISRDPTFGEVYYHLGFAYEQKGMFRKAMHANQKYFTLMGYNTPAVATIRASPVLDARDYWEKMVELAKPPTGSEFNAAEAWAQLGETDKALASLEQACAKRGYGISYLKVNPNLDPLRAHPRFQELLRQVKLAQ
jgi:eukaryotic-like serine/threonine-protein kinase